MLLLNSQFEIQQLCQEIYINIRITIAYHKHFHSDIKGCQFESQPHFKIQNDEIYRQLQLGKEFFPLQTPLCTKRGDLWHHRLKTLLFRIDEQFSFAVGIDFCNIFNMLISFLHIVVRAQGNCRLQIIGKDCHVIRIQNH